MKRKRLIKAIVCISILFILGVYFNLIELMYYFDPSNLYRNESALDVINKYHDAIIIKSKSKIGKTWVWDHFKTDSIKYTSNVNKDVTVYKDFIRLYCSDMDKHVILLLSNYWNDNNIKHNASLFYATPRITDLKNDKHIRVLIYNEGTYRHWTNHPSRIYNNVDLLMKYTFSENAFSANILMGYGWINKELLYNYIMTNGSNYIDFEHKNDADIAWFGGNCEAWNGREKYLKELFNHISAHSFGTCLNNIWKWRISKTRSKCNNDNIMKIISQYKFYIVIENSNCIDYITEKITRIMKFNAIPILYMENNIPNYNLILPNNSYINIADYKSVKHLANYLKLVSNNKTLWESYFWYKGNISVYNNIIDNLIKYNKVNEFLNDYKPTLCRLGKEIMEYNATINVNKKHLVDKEFLPKNSIEKYIFE